MKLAVFSMPTWDPEMGISQGEFMQALVDHLASAEDMGFDLIFGGISFARAQRSMELFASEGAKSIPSPPGGGGLGRGGVPHGPCGR